MPDSPTDDLATRLAKLEDDLKTEREQNAQHRETLRALEARNSAPADRRGQPSPMARLSREDAQGLAEELGGEWTPALVQQNYAVIEAMFRHAARPVMNGLQGMADVLDLVHTRQELPDFKAELEADATKVRDEHIQKGQFITRKQAAAIVRSRRMEDPKYQDELADRRLKERETEAEKRAGEQTAATTEGTGRAATQSAGPSATKASKTPLDKESFERAPLEEKRKILDESGIAF